MVSKKKIQELKEVKELLKKHPVIGILDMHGLPARQLHSIRNMLRGEATIRMVKKRLISLAFKESGLDGIEKLSEMIRGEPALLLSNTNPFRLARKIDSAKSKAFAKAGDIAPHDIIVKAGPTPLPPGPAIGELQRLKIPAGVEGDKIAVKQDTIVAKEGEEISPELAGLLAKLGIEPMEIGLNLIAAWENGIIYNKDILFVPPEKYIEDLKAAHARAFRLAFSIGYYTKENITLFLQKAHREAVALALDREIPTKYTIKQLLAKANAEKNALKSKLQIKEPETVSGDSKESGQEPENPEEGKNNQETGNQEEQKTETSEETGSSSQEEKKE